MFDLNFRRKHYSAPSSSEQIGNRNERRETIEMEQTKTIEKFVDRQYERSDVQYSTITMHYFSYV